MKRQRPIRSCLACRERRLRCDKLHPTCSRCALAKINCTYDHATTSFSSDEAAVRLNLSQTQAGGPPIESTGTAPVAQASAQGPSTHERGQLFVQHGGRSSYVGPTFWGNAIAADNANTDQTTPQNTMLKVINPFPRWFVPYESVVNWENEQAGHMRSNRRQTPKLDLSNCKFCGQKYKFACTLALLPPKEICDRLCEIFFSTVFPLMPILHVQGFADDYRTFWQERGDGGHHDTEVLPLLRRKPSFVCLLFSMLFAALKCTSEPQVHSALSDASETRASDYYTVALICITITGFPRRPSHDSLAAYLFTQNPFVMEEDFAELPDFISIAFRVGLSMGLHRKLTHSDLSYVEFETRRRLWWYILHLDVMSSCSSGMSPLFINQKMANIEMISQHDLRHDQGTRDDDLVDLRYLVAARRYEMSRMMRQVLELHFEDALQSIEQVNEVAEQIQALAKQVNHTVQLLLLQSRNEDSSLSKTPALLFSAGSHTEGRSFDRVWKLNGGRDPEASGFCSWAAMLLHLMVHKSFCVLYHALFRDPSLVSHPPFRTSAVLHAQAFVQVFLRVCTDPVSEPYQWMYPGIFQPLQALSLLLADLLKYPHGPQALLSRGLVDAIFDKYQVDAGLVSTGGKHERHLSPVGRDAWKMLADSRARVWQLLREDHHVLMPSQTVSSDVCVCGDRFAESKSNSEPDNYAAVTEAVDLVSPAHLFQTGNMQGVSMFQTAAEGTTGHQASSAPQTDFDWQEWDNAFGTSLSFIS